jgi:hypothetical protein
MSTIHVEFARELHFGDDAVLLAMDGPGVAVFAAALKDVARQSSSQLEHGGVTHLFRIEAGAAAVELHNDRVVWRLDPEKLTEIVDDLDALSANDRPGHHYVDITEPAETLVISRDEYRKRDGK